MRYLLDTTVLISMIKDQHGARRRIEKSGFENCAVSEITLGELIYGAYKGGYERHIGEADFVKNTFKILPIGNSLDTYGRLRAELEAKGTVLDSFDLLIASTAIDANLTLVTHNTRHFERISDLKLTDWEQD